jgi:mRNA interferase MazF
VKGDVVVVSFPFSDLSAAKRRPAIVIAELRGDDIILCAVTGGVTGDAEAVLLTSADFVTGALARESFARPGHLFTADRALIAYQIGQLTNAKLQQVIDAIVDIVRT